MLPVLIRAIIVYVIVIVGVRLMGKRQIGELQPSELVITFLLSDVASMPLQNSSTPLLQSVATVFLLIALEVITSCLALKFRPFRTLIQGHSVMIIKKGELQQENMKRIRYSVDDIIESLRLKDIFDVSEVDYAYVETNGSLSVLPKKSKNESAALPCLVVSDGKIIEREFALCGMTRKKLERILKKKGLELQNILLMTFSEDGRANIVLKKEVSR